MISIEEIKHLEELSNLQFTDQQREKFVKEFESIMEFASQISSVECKNESFINSIDMDLLREDIIEPSLPQEKIISNAPQKLRGCFVVPKIME